MIVINCARYCSLFFRLLFSASFVNVVAVGVAFFPHSAFCSSVGGAIAYVSIRINLFPISKTFTCFPANVEFGTNLAAICSLSMPVRCRFLIVILIRLCFFCLPSLGWCAGAGAGAGATPLYMYIFGNCCSYFPSEVALL